MHVFPLRANGSSFIMMYEYDVSMVDLFGLILFFILVVELHIWNNMRRELVCFLHFQEELNMTIPNDFAQLISYHFIPSQIHKNHIVRITS